MLCNILPWGQQVQQLQYRVMFVQVDNGKIGSFLNENGNLDHTAALAHSAENSIILSQLCPIAPGVIVIISALVSLIFFSANYVKPILKD